MSRCAMGLWALVGAAIPSGLGGGGARMLPTTSPPIIYTINYSGDYFRKPEYIEQFRAAPPDLLHVGKATPISHHWGPIRLYQGENQYTGGPRHTLSWENIALLSPQQLEERIATIRETLERYHAIGIREIAPYISYHTVAGDHEKRKGLWEFYDKWDTYAKWAGPKPKHDPLDWLVVDKAGKFVGGSCGGYSPAYYAPLHRYRACINHPDWAEWHRRLIRLVAEVGYDGCFVDNAHPDACYCRHCKALFRAWLAEHRDVAWVRRLTEGADVSKLALDSEGISRELVRRWRVTRTGEHLGMLREVGRKVRPGFTIFPNSGRIDECLQVGSQSDRLMFESTFSPGIQAAGEPPETEELRVAVSPYTPTDPRPITHRYELHDGATWMELCADITLPTRVCALRGARFTVKVLSVGASLQDGDAAEDFHLLLRGVKTGHEVRVALEPRGAVGGTASSRKPKQPPVTLTGVWTVWKPEPADDAYSVHFGFRYTDDSHLADTNRRLRLDRLSRGRTCRTHVAELLFAQHMAAKPIYLGYEAKRRGREAAQELALAELAAFSGGGGFSGAGAPQAKYRAFFKKHPELFDGWQPTADVAVLYSYWGPNALNTYKPSPTPTIAEYLGGTHRPFVALVDRTLPEKAEELARFGVIYLASPAYEMTDAQLEALTTGASVTRHLLLADEKVTINGRRALDLPAAWLVTHWGPGVGVWDWREPFVRTRSVAPTDGLRKNLRFALYRKGNRLALHAVNYNVCLLDKARRVLTVEPTPLRIPTPRGWTRATATCYDPDAPPVKVECAIDAGIAQLSLPAIRIYKIVLLEKK